MAPKTLAFPKSSKLKSKVRIAQLQGRAPMPLGRAAVLHTKTPLLRCAYTLVPARADEGSGAPRTDEKFMVSVPKKLIKSAVHRNHLKRRIRESYRLLRAEILMQTAPPQELHIILTYRLATLATTTQIADSVHKILSRIAAQ